MTPSQRPLPPDIENRLREVAWQYRRREAAKGWVRLALLAMGVVTVFAVTVPLARVNAIPLYVPAIVCAIVLLISAWRWVVRPLTTALSLREIALFIDEHHPKFQNRLITAVELYDRGGESVSPWMLEQVLRESRALALTTPFQHLFDARSMKRWARIMACAWVVVALGLFVFRGAWLPPLESLHQEVRLESMPFTVEPGDQRVRSGSHQMVWVTTANKDQQVAIQWRTPGGPWQSAAMAPSTANDVHYHEFRNIQSTIEYQVQAARVRSPVYTFQVWTPPSVEAIHLSYTYPEYLGMEDKDTPHSGNIAAVEGTRVRLEVDVNKPVERAELVLASGPRIPLAIMDTTLWTGELIVDTTDSYVIELTDDEGETNTYRREYSVKAIPDRAPEITIEFPRGDGEAFAMEEIPFGFKVTDDFGLASYGIQYEIPGREPVRITLEEGISLASAQGDHVLMLEDLDLAPGDFLTWTVWAEDFKPDRSEYETVGFPYFLEIRPYRRLFSESLSDQGAGQGGEGGGSEASDQKMVIIATWNLRGMARDLDDDEFEEKRDAIIDNQRRLLAAAEQASSMGGEGGMDVVEMLTAMNNAIAELEEAVMPSPEGHLSAAINHMQTAYRHLLRMRPDEVEVMQQTSTGGGGGGGGGQQDLPDMESLEVERRQNFHEEASTLQSQQQAAEEAASSLRDLIRRQEIVNEDIAKLLSELESASEEEKEEIQRRLEQLREEQQRNLQELDQLAGEIASGRMESEQAQRAQQPLDDARRQMNRGVESLNQENLQRARAASARALDALEEMREQLEQLTRAGAAERMRELADAMDALREQQESIVNETDRINDARREPGLEALAEAQERAEQLIEEKRQLAESFTDLLEEAGELSERAATSQELMSQKLGDWLRTTSGEGILEDMEEAEPLLQFGVWDSALEKELGVQDKLDRVAERLADVAQHAVSDELDALQKALAQLDTLLDAPEEARAGSAANDGEEQPGRQGAQSGEPGSDAGAGESAESGEARGESGEASSDSPGAGGQPGEQDSESGSGQPGGEGQPGQRGQGGTGEPDGQPSDSAGQQPGTQDAPGAPGQPGALQAGRGGADGGSRGGGWSGGNFDDFQRFLQDGSAEWVDTLRNAEALLPDGSPLRNQVGALRGDVEAMRRAFRRDYLAPQFDLYLDIGDRLVKTADAISDEIARRLKDHEFLLADEGEVPSQYATRVAEYFRALSESEIQQ